MASLAQGLPLLLNLGVVSVGFALGLQATPANIAFIWQRPSLLLRSLLAMELVVPASTVVIVLLLGLPRPVLIGLLALAVSPGAPFVPPRLVRRPPYVYSLIAAVSLLAIGTVPLSLAILSPLFAADPGMTAGEAAKAVTLVLLLPLGLGLGVRWWWPDAAERAARPVALGANLLMTAAILLVLFRASPALLALEARAIVAAVLLAATALVAGHLLGGPHPEDRTALAVACAVRPPGLALLVAAACLPADEVAVMIFVCCGISCVVSLPYIAWRKKWQAADMVATGMAKETIGEKP